MKLAKVTKFILMISCLYFFFPSYSNGIFTFILKFFVYLVMMYIAYVLINDGVNLISKNWGKMKYLWIDEREHAKGNTLANLSRMDFIGAIFRLIHYYRFNKKRLFQEMWYGYLDNKTPINTFILIVFIIVGFIIYRLL